MASTPITTINKAEEAKPTTPWKPYNKINITLKDPNFSPRWIREDKLAKSLQEGWSIVRQDEVQDSASLSIVDGTVVNGKIMRGKSLVLCKMHKDMVASRNEYYRKQGADLLKNQTTKLQQEVENNNYGQIKVKELK